MRRMLAGVLLCCLALLCQVGIAEAASTPSRPLNPKATPGNGQVIVKWSAPSSTGGKPIDRYRVQRATSSKGPWTTFARPRASSRTYTATGLTNGKAYNFRVSAHNAAGWGTPSTRVSATPRTVPSSPTNLTANPGDGQATIEWLAPSSDGGAVIDWYQVQAREDGTAEWVNGWTTSTGDEVSLVASDLTPGTTYEFRVRGHNVAGYGAAAGPVAATVPGPLRAVSALATSPTTVVMTFNQPVDVATLNPSAAGFAADKGLTFSGASVSGANVILTSSTQQPLETYTITAAPGLTNTSGTPLDPAADTAAFAGFSPPVTAFRFTDLDLREPHVYVYLLGSHDVTDAALAGFTINGALQTNLATDSDSDGFLDQSPVNLFRPLDQAASTVGAELHLGALCASGGGGTCGVGTPGVTSTATNQGAGICLQPEAGTTTASYSPDVVNAVAPCFSTTGSTVTLDLAGIPLTLQDARLAATYAGNPAVGETNGLLSGFLSEQVADNTIIPASMALIGGQPLSSILPGGTNNSASHSDMDLHNGTPGWWFYFNFTATPTGWVD